MAVGMTAVFDIGKTNKKFFLFDRNFQEIYRDYTRLEEIEDEDGHPMENLPGLQNWIQGVFDRVLKSKKFDISAINFSSYGASFVHLGDKGKVVAPLYNYTKPIADSLVDRFYDTYGPESEFLRVTGTSREGMLNSGLQLYWLKHTKPEVFKSIRYSLHLPQYLSYLFTGIPVSEYTSIGCHTALWDYTRQDYHDWVYREGMHGMLPPIVPTDTSVNGTYRGKRLRIGVGIHDSSAALLPYLRSVEKKFLLVSTGTWSITLNPFAEKALEDRDIQTDCINYMRLDGGPVKASRLFLGREYSLQVSALTEMFQVDRDYHKRVAFDPILFERIRKRNTPMFRWKAIESHEMPEKSHIAHDNFEAAYHQLLYELVGLQVAAIQRAKGDQGIKRLYVEGGFTDNRLFLELLANSLPHMKLRTTDASLGSALGAAIAISDTRLDRAFLKENYALKKHTPLIVK